MVTQEGDLGKDGSQMMPALVYNDGLCPRGTRNSLKDCLYVSMWLVICVEVHMHVCAYRDQKAGNIKS